MSKSYETKHLHSIVYGVFYFLKIKNKNFYFYFDCGNGTVATTLKGGKGLNNPTLIFSKHNLSLPKGGILSH